MAVVKSKHFPNLALGTEAVTGSLAIRNPFPGKDVSVQLALRGDLTEQAKAPFLSVGLSTDKKTITIYAGKVTASGDNTIIAATSEVTVDVFVFAK